MAVCWHGDDGDGRPVVTPPAWLGWLLSGVTWLLIVAYVVLLGVGLVLGPTDLDAWLVEVLR